MNTSHAQQESQVEAGHRIVVVYIIKGKKAQQEHFADLTVCEKSDRQYIIDRDHRYSSTNHYYEGMEQNPADYHNGQDTMRKIAEKEAMMAQYPTGAIAIFSKFSKKTGWVTDVLPLAEFEAKFKN